MTGESDSLLSPATIDNRLRAWRQGDCVLGEQWFVYRVDPRFGLTRGARAANEQGSDLAESLEAGLTVVTQTCDIVRHCEERPFLEVCPLVEVSDENFAEIRRGRRPAYAYLPLTAARLLVVDLDRVMTVEKAVAASWTRTAGWHTDQEARAFAHALARKRRRFAFPDDFVAFARKLVRRLTDKHASGSDEGRGLRSLREIRVQALPAWDAAEVTLLFWCLRHDEAAAFEGKSWADLAESWSELVPPSGRFVASFLQVATLNEMTAADYVGSDLLDLDHLSPLA